MRGAVFICIATVLFTSDPESGFRLAAAVKSEAELTRIEVVGARGDPLKMQQLRRRLDVTAYKCAIILCDQSWLDPDLDLSNGIALKSQSDMLRLDAMVMAVQLNIRKLLEVSCNPSYVYVTLVI